MHLFIDSRRVCAFCSHCHFFNAAFENYMLYHDDNPLITRLPRSFFLSVQEVEYEEHDKEEKLLHRQLRTLIMQMEKDSDSEVCHVAYLFAPFYRKYPLR